MTTNIHAIGLETRKEPGRVDPARHRGPPLALVAAVHAILVLAGIIAPTVMAGGQHFPSPFDADASRWFSEYPGAALTSAFFLFGSSVPLAVFAASVSSRLQFLGMKVAGVHIALVGGVAASVALATSGFALWVLAQPGIADTSGVAHALHWFAFAAGGPGFAVPLGLLISGIALVGGIQGFIPRWLMWLGLVLAAVAELAVLAFIWVPAMYLLPVARFLGMFWLIGAAAALPKSRRRADLDQASTAARTGGEAWVR
jgi:hypothetical protein